MMSLLALTPVRRRGCCCWSCSRIHHVGNIRSQRRARTCRLDLPRSTAVADKGLTVPGYPLFCPVGKLTNLANICNPRAATKLIECKMAFEVVTGKSSPCRKIRNSRVFTRRKPRDINWRKGPLSLRYAILSGATPLVGRLIELYGTPDRPLRDA